MGAIADHATTCRLLGAALGALLSTSTASAGTNTVVALTGSRTSASEASASVASASAASATAASASAASASAASATALSGVSAASRLGVFSSFGAQAAPDQPFRALRGVTLGPIESQLQPGRGYGSSAFDATLGEVRRLGGNWISLTVFGRVWDLDSTGIEMSFEAPWAETQENVRRAVRLAHAQGLQVLLVPHLWIESRKWRAELDPGSDDGWKRWASSYERFVLSWAQLAEESGVDLFAVGVEMRSWLTTTRAPSFAPILRQIRAAYSGPLTYAANWDDAEDTVIWGDLDVIGINAFYQLHWEDDATTEQLMAGGKRVAEQVTALGHRYKKPVIFTEFGYVARKNTAIKPWLWPEELGAVQLDQEAQAEAYSALLSAMVDVPEFAGLFVWRMYADLADLSQEPDWGFSPWGKSSQQVLRDAYETRFAADRL